MYTTRTLCEEHLDLICWFKEDGLASRPPMCILCVDPCLARHAQSLNSSLHDLWLVLQIGKLEILLKQIKVDLTKYRPDSVWLDRLILESAADSIFAVNRSYYCTSGFGATAEYSPHSLVLFQDFPFTE